MLAGPARSAACITFARPSAKSNSAEVKAVTIGIGKDSSRFDPFCSASASSFRIPSAAPSEAWISAWTGERPCRPVRASSTLLNPEITWPALAATASASTALLATWLLPLVVPLVPYLLMELPHLVSLASFLWAVVLWDDARQASDELQRASSAPAAQGSRRPPLPQEGLEATLEVERLAPGEGIP